MSQWSIDAALIRHTVVTVEATTQAEAEEKFNALQWVDAGDAQAELIDWRIRAAPVEDKPSRRTE